MDNRRTWRKYRTVLGLVVFCLGGLRARQFEAPGNFVLFPPKTLIDSFVADGTAHRFGAEKAFEVNEVFASMGGIFPVLESFSLGFPAELSVGASAHLTLEPGESIAIISNEYYVDFLLIDILWSDRFFSKFGMGHTSHHLGDRAALLAKRLVTDYSRDYAKGAVGYSWGGGRLYAGANYGYGFVIDVPVHKPWLLEVGGDAAVYRFNRECVLFVAADLMFRQESGFGSTQRFRTGFEFRRAGHIFRIAMAYKAGLDERGQFYQQRNSSFSAGLFVDL